MPPSNLETSHTGEFLFSEAEGTRSREIVTIKSGQKLAAGAVLAAITDGAATAAADSGNTGNGTMSAVTTAFGVAPGPYHVNFVAATTFEVEGPDGKVIPGKGATGSAYSGGGLGFTITAGGTAFVAGDGFTITVAAGSGKYVALGIAGTEADGSDKAAAILWDACDASATGTNADTKATVIARAAEVVAALLVYPSGTTTNQKTAALAALATAGITAR